MIPTRRVLAVCVQTLVLACSGWAQTSGVCPSGGIVGDVRDYVGRPIGNARVTLSLSSADGKLIWQSPPVLVDGKDGGFTIAPGSLPQNLSSVKAAVLTAESREYFGGKVEMQTTYDSAGKLTFAPCNVAFRLEWFNPWLTLLFLLPAMFGSVWATVHLTQFATKRVWVTSAYAIGVASLWAANSLAFVAVYIWHGDVLVPLFWPDLFVSSGVILGAVLGTLTYIAYALHVKGEGFYDSVSTGALRKILRTVAGRTLVAPYVAVVANVTLAAAFPSLRTGSFAFFFAFFTGLYIKVVLDNLNAIGTHFLTQETRQKVVDMMARQQVPGAPEPKQSEPSHVPSKAFLDAVNAVRTDLIANNDAVVGVEPATKSDGSGAVVVYLDPTRPIDAEHRVPAQISGFPTDVKPLPPAPTSQVCRSAALNVAWRKVGSPRGRENGNQPRDSEIFTAGQVTVIADPAVWVRTTAGSFEFRADIAYSLLRKSVEDSFDFVCFVIATGTWGSAASDRAVGNFYVPVFNDIGGINHYKKSGFDERASWGTQRLRGCQVICQFSPALDRRTFLHELGHAWCSYVTFDDPDTGTKASPLLLYASDSGVSSDGQGLYHWARHFDDGSSCMDYDLVRWIEQPPGTFTAQSVDDAHFEYCNLDRYLMGFLPKDKVGPLTILPDLGNQQSAYSGRVKRISIDDVIRSCGERQSASGTQTAFRQAWVVISADTISGRGFATKLDGFRQEVENAFFGATGNIATLHTSLS